MSTSNKKPNSFLRTIFVVYILFILVTNVMGNSMPRLSNFSGIIIILVVLLIASQVFSAVKKNTKSDSFSFTQSTKTVSDKMRKTQQPVSSTKRVSRNKEISSVDKPYTDLKSNNGIGFVDMNDHYIRQYKELYEAGIMSKEELMDKIRKKK
ncbi:MAG: hypothetical protein JXQ26_00770 [Tissierellales bacterium]|nr:hypothetical protein [Tissierellales bacterium]MBN2826489.1 hypothetical protein [Tissierellales bacterium]